MPVLPEKKKLMARAADGDMAAASTLIRVYHMDTIALLVTNVWPLGNPPPAAFDALADSIACFEELKQLKELN